jgi:hypothetical protein
MDDLRINRWCLYIFLSLILSAGSYIKALAQPECMAWGNLTGIRVEGQLIEFESSLCLIGSSLMQVTHTAKEQQRPRYRLQGKTIFCLPRLSKTWAVAKQ